MMPSAKVEYNNSMNWAVHAATLGFNEKVPTAPNLARVRNGASPNLLRAIIEAALPTPENYAALKLAHKGTAEIKPSEQAVDIFYISGFGGEQAAQNFAAVIKQTGFTKSAIIGKPNKSEPWIVKYFDLSLEEMGFLKKTFVKYSNEDLRVAAAWASRNPEWSNRKSEQYLPQLETLNAVMEERGIVQQGSKPKLAGKAEKTAVAAAAK